VAVTPGVWLPAFGGESLTADTLRRTGSMAFFWRRSPLSTRRYPGLRKPAERVPTASPTSREKVSSVANFIFTFSDAMG
jgi:hypothetical protein